jgi:hypothetical protein
MIRPLRRRHRCLWLVLAWAVPLLCGVALLRRPGASRQGSDSLPASQLYDLLEGRPRAEPGVRERSR